MSDVSIHTVDNFDEETFQKLVRENLEDTGIFIREWEYRENNIKEFSKSAPKIRIGAFDDDRLVGLSWGEAGSENRFVMNMSLVIPEYRGRGIYSKMLDLMLEETKAYDEVESFHHMLNNNILSLKLRRGFHIVGFDQSGLIGPRIRMKYFHNKKLLEILEFRAGLRNNPFPYS